MIKSKQKLTLVNSWQNYRSEKNKFKKFYKEIPNSYKTTKKPIA